MFDFVVIGKGLIGSAAIRYLSQNGTKTAIIGPDEPKDWSSHQGVFSSHHDSGRITRILDEDLIWATLAQRSIASYPQIEKDSQISFYSPVGGLQVAPNPQNSTDYMAQLRAVDSQLNVQATYYQGEELQQIFPFFSFSSQMVGIFEKTLAGYINPRKMLKAQLVCAEKNKAQILNETVTSVDKQKDFVAIKTDQDHIYQAKRVLIAAGPYSHLLIDPRLDAYRKAITIVLAEISESARESYKKMPSLIYEFPGNPILESIYLVPPTQYPNGKYYLKIGGHFTSEPNPTSFNELTQWFQSKGSFSEGEVLKEVLFSTIPSLKDAPTHTQPCVVTYTQSDRPYLDILAQDQIFIATGGCGAAAKSSDEIGKIATRLIENGSWDYDLPEALFHVRFSTKRPPSKTG